MLCRSIIHIVIITIHGMVRRHIGQDGPVCGTFVLLGVLWNALWTCRVRRQHAMGRNERRQLVVRHMLLRFGLVRQSLSSSPGLGLNQRGGKALEGKEFPCRPSSVNGLNALGGLVCMCVVWFKTWLHIMYASVPFLNHQGRQLLF